MALSFLNDVANDAESTQNRQLQIDSLKGEPTCKLIKRIPGLRLLYQVYQTPQFNKRSGSLA